MTYSVVVGSDVVSVGSSTGLVTPSKIGTAVIKASAAAVGSYLAAEATYIVHVIEHLPSNASATAFGRLNASAACFACARSVCRQTVHENNKRACSFK